MKRSDVLALAGLVALTALAFVDKVAAEAVVTYLGGLLIKAPAVETVKSRIYH